MDIQTKKFLLDISLFDDEKIVELIVKCNEGQAYLNTDLLLNEKILNYEIESKDEEKQTVYEYLAKNFNNDIYLDITSKNSVEEVQELQEELLANDINITQFYMKINIKSDQIEKVLFDYDNEKLDKMEINDRFKYLQNKQQMEKNLFQKYIDIYEQIQENGDKKTNDLDDLAISTNIAEIFLKTIRLKQSTNGQIQGSKGEGAAFKALKIINESIPIVLREHEVYGYIIGGKEFQKSLKNITGEDYSCNMNAQSSLDKIIRQLGFAKENSVDPMEADNLKNGNIILG
ncbi:hypothetical protein PPERSA_07314 [Pseudocohnilembus persalinus]|uniref:Uncharacterized protein n=1 Tax=Pseudocohnilembus persalinus TaxID=266149 RepID=A0A0V0R7M5_PSEPJ|nr:hypothetical protein PPERSA_07314 [Pseudocohnilembus persalinus]|eukprot:KRX10229.1 hypothetical protein PPERSA_07314 [Pseudocohnilembus persalinus]